MKPAPAHGIAAVVLTLAALGVALAGCKTDTTQNNTGSMDAEAMGAVGRSNSAQPEGQSASAVVAPEEEETAPPAGGAGVQAHPNRPLLPPAKPGDSVSRFEGCLASKSPSEADGAAFPAAPAPKPGTRGPPSPPALTVTPTGGGAVVEHRLNHACCLKGHVSSAVEDQTVTITETLDGDPCRCLCASTLKAAVGLAPGTYTVKVEVIEGGAAPRSGGEATVTVR